MTSRGDSFNFVVTRDGNHFLLRSQGKAVEGEIVSGTFDGDSNVITFLKSDVHYWLIPDNQNRASTPVDIADVLGNVTARLSLVR